MCSSVSGFVWLKEKMEKKNGPGAEEGREVCGGERERIALLVSTLLGRMTGTSVFSAFKWGHSRKYPLDSVICGCTGGTKG